MLLFAPVVSIAHDLESGVPIRISDELALSRHGELVSVLVPFSEKDAILTTVQARIEDEGGVEVPVQWRVQQRWRGAPSAGDRPIRFALARFGVDLAPGQTRTFTLRRRTPLDAPPKVPDQAIQVGLENDVLWIDTGPIRVGLRLFQHQLFHAVDADLDGDGEFEPDERVIAPDGVGAMLIDVKDGVYLGLLDPSIRWYLEEAGPLRLVFRIDGAHQPNLGGIGRDYFGFSTRYAFEAGSDAVRVEHVLRNTYLDEPLGAMTFARYLLHTKIAGDEPLVATFGAEEGGAFPISVDLSAVDSAFVYQDSSGEPQWNQPGTTFAGFRLYEGGPFASPVRPEELPAGRPLFEGLHAEGWMNVEDQRKGVLVALRYAWQNYPFALRAFRDRHIVADLWPAEFAGTHWLDDAQRKAHHLVYQFHDGSIDPRHEAIRLTNPLHPVIDLDYLRATRAWADQGDLRDPHVDADDAAQHAAKEWLDFLAFTDATGGFGWMNFGEHAGAKSTHATGSPRNKLTYFDRFMSTGLRSWFAMQEVFALHSMDLRTYHIDGFAHAAHPGAHLPEGLPHYTGTDMLGRDQIPEYLAPYKEGIPEGGHGWNGYDAEHMSVDDLYEYYLLTGSFGALDALRKIGEGMKTWKIIDPSKPLGSSRAIGWSLRALTKIHQVTGDPALLDKARDLVAIVHEFRGQDPSPKTGIPYHYLARTIYGGGSHGMTEDYDLPWQIAVGIYGLSLYHRETQDESVPPVIAELSRYILDYCVVDGVIVEALACDDHTDFNAKSQNDGVNTWIPSALAIAWRATGDDELLDLASDIFYFNDGGFLDDNPTYPWLHTIAEVLEGGEQPESPLPAPNADGR